MSKKYDSIPWYDDEGYREALRELNTLAEPSFIEGDVGLNNITPFPKWLPENRRESTPSPLRSLRMANKIFIDNNLYRKKNSVSDEVYKKLNTPYSTTSNTHRQILDMLSQNLAKNNEFKGVNLSSKPLGKYGEGIQLGAYDHLGKKVNLGMDDKSMSIFNPIINMNHEFLHAYSNLKKVDEKKDTANTSPYYVMNDFFKEKGYNPDTYSALPKEIIKTIQDAQDIVDPSEQYKTLYPARTVDLYNNQPFASAEWDERKEGRPFFRTSPDELNTHLLERVDNKIFPSNNPSANELVKNTANNLNSHFGRMLSTKYKDHPLPQQAFNDVANAMNQKSELISGKMPSNKNKIWFDVLSGDLPWNNQTSQPYIHQQTQHQSSLGNIIGQQQNPYSMASQGMSGFGSGMQSMMSHGQNQRDGEQQQKQEEDKYYRRGGRVAAPSRRRSNFDMQRAIQILELLTRGMA